MKWMKIPKPPKILSYARKRSSRTSRAHRKCARVMRQFVGILGIFQVFSGIYWFSRYFIFYKTFGKEGERRNQGRGKLKKLTFLKSWRVIWWVSESNFSATFWGYTRWTLWRHASSCETHFLLEFLSHWQRKNNEFSVLITVSFRKCTTSYPSSLFSFQHRKR